MTALGCPGCACRGRRPHRQGCPEGEFVQPHCGENDALRKIAVSSDSAETCPDCGTFDEHATTCKAARVAKWKKWAEETPPQAKEA